MAKRDGVGECSDEVMMPRAYRHALTRSRATGGLRGDEAATPGVDLGGHRHPGQEAVAGNQPGIGAVAISVITCVQKNYLLFRLIKI